MFRKYMTLWKRTKFEMSYLFVRGKYDIDRKIRNEVNCFIGMD